MKVKDLIEELKKFDQEKEIRFRSPSGITWDIYGHRTRKDDNEKLDCFVEVQ